MADKNVTLRRRNSSSWDYLYPETLVEQIVGLTTIGTNLLEATNPGADRFVKILSDGTVSFIDGDTLLSDIGGAEVGHDHNISDINGLNTALAGKAGVDASGKLLAAHVPDFLLGGMKFERATDSGDLSAGNLDLDDLFSEIPGSSEDERKGYYFIIHTDCTLTTSGSSIVQAPGDEGDYTLPISIEAGDYVAYLGESGGDHLWSIINNTYVLASTSSKGVVQLSDATAALRSSLDGSSNPQKVIDERALRNVMKDIIYSATEPTGVEGDLWFEGSF